MLGSFTLSASGFVLFSSCLIASIKLLNLSLASWGAKSNNWEDVTSGWAFLTSFKFFIDPSKAVPFAIAFSVEGVLSFPSIGSKLESLIAWVTAALWSVFKCSKFKVLSLAFLASFVALAAFKSSVNVVSVSKLSTPERSSPLTSLLYFSFSSFER